MARVEKLESWSICKYFEASTIARNEPAYWPLRLDSHSPPFLPLGHFIAARGRFQWETGDRFATKR